MLTSQTLWSGRHLPLLAADNDGGGPAGPSGATAATAATGTTGDANATGTTGTGERGDDKEALRRMGEQRDAAREDARRVTEERDALLKEKNDLAAAEQKRKDKEAAEAGKWEELATKREVDLTTATEAVTRLTSENDQLKAAMADGLTARVKDLPDSVRKVLDDTVADDDVLARWQWLHKPSVQELIKAAGGGVEASRANGGMPKSSGNGTAQNNDAALRANAARYG